MIIINNAKRAIEVSKDFAKKASVYGSFEYKELQGAKNDYPTYRVCVKNSGKRKFEDKLTIKDMATYIREHSGEDSAEMKTFAELRGVSVKDAASIFETVESAKFTDIKNWFFLTYPDLAKKTETRKNRINAILADAAEKAAQSAEAAKNAASAA